MDSNVLWFSNVLRTLLIFIFARILLFCLVFGRFVLMANSSSVDYIWRSDVLRTLQIRIFSTDFVVCLVFGRVADMVNSRALPAWIV